MNRTARCSCRFSGWCLIIIFSCVLDSFLLRRELGKKKRYLKIALAPTWHLCLPNTCQNSSVSSWTGKQQKFSSQNHRISGRQTCLVSDRKRLAEPFSFYFLVFLFIFRINFSSSRTIFSSLNPSWPCRGFRLKLRWSKFPACLSLSPLSRINISSPMSCSIWCSRPTVSFVVIQFYVLPAWKNFVVFIR